MTVPHSKDELLAAIALEFGKLLKALDDVPLDCAQLRSMDGHARGTLMRP
ncbi:hypothetical protein [Shinella sp.]|nr:hypothetical protein [Shinella sp.]